MKKYRDRIEAGKILAEMLKDYANRTDTIVLALPRGGVPVAYEIAKALNLPLDVFIVRKLGVPHHKELAMGAIAIGDVTVFNDEIIDKLGIPKFAIDQAINAEKQELKRRELHYRGNRAFPDLYKKTILLVDDGIATGATISAAVKALWKLNPAKIIIVVPVAEAIICANLAKQVDKVICPLCPDLLHAVGTWYESFDQTSDEEVSDLLASAINDS